ncbi:hypothetical protein E1263_25705 [Kribbella antibiotica]|uniref:Uncharacterized protein n=1 Tax=Kribbella antibiotica TaxID=190195 RepID=A0A4V2YNW0_9ACTN|nr:hypothetical protein [Kribbella antibiotica]TDD55877.1 hypothetical protein E1263_25705 [Kribbella antibiotica]
MNGIVVIAVLVLALIAALEVSHRRHTADLDGSTGDRDVARTKLDLLALGGSAKPFTGKPTATPAAVRRIHVARLSHPGRHAA